VKTVKEMALRGGVARLVDTGNGFSAVLIRNGTVIAKVDDPDGAMAMARLQGGHGRIEAAPREATYTLSEGPYVEVAKRIEQASGGVFLTGRAGTGKTTFLKAFLDSTELKAAIVAPSGIAALNAGGQTIHSLFKLPPAMIQPQDVRRVRDGRMLKALDLLVIDEISMVRSDLMDAIDRSMRLHRGVARPFGGVRVLCVGDSAQLPPVVSREDEPVLENWFGGPYFFDAPAVKAMDWTAIELQQVFRQSEARFLDLLDRLRRGRPSRDDAELLDERVVGDPPPFEDDANEGGGDGAIVLTTTNEAARRINDREMARLSGAEATYGAKVEGQFDERIFPTDNELTLRVGARVMLLRNDMDKRWVNGTLGTVVDLGKTSVFVRIGRSTYEIEPADWERYVYEPDGVGVPQRKPVGIFRQVPLRPAWALTIHKAQGLTFDAVHVDFGNGAFAHGQTYVALSRCRTLSGLTLSRHLRRTDVRVDDAAFAFADRATYADMGAFRVGRIEA
jgi:ATP-dependent DNA helicase PIF1